MKMLELDKVVCMFKCPECGDEQGITLQELSEYGAPICCNECGQDTEEFELFAAGLNDE